jgi:eukaryotic-like serine/threonine-protein kinase
MTMNAPPSTSLVAGKYELLGIIGRGGMGSVWEGKHVSLGTRVAIKFIEKEYAESKEARARFDNEARAAATIQSKHAIQIFDHGVTDDGKPYIVMEMLQGEPLDKRLDRLGRLPLQDVARILNQVCRALQRAHDGGIVHRDLKPENIFLVRTPDDDEDVAKVLDFGIAKIRGTAGSAPLSNSTKTGAVLGTPYYMSPEQARGMRDIDHRTDLWSLGVIVFKCVTGVLPFEGESLGDLLVKICTTPVPVPSQVLPGLSHAFDAWFARALDRDPQKRFGSASEMSDALAYACGVSVKRPASGTEQQLASARTVASYPPSAYSQSQSQSGSGQRAATGPGRSGSQPGYDPPRYSQGGPGTTPSPQGYGTPHPGYGTPHPAYGPPNVTSSQFAASTPRARGSSGGTIAAVAVGMLLVGGLGVLGVTRLMRSKDQPPVTAGPGVSTVGAGGVVPVPLAPTAVITSPVASLAPSAEVVVNTPPATSTGASTSAVKAPGGRAGRPPAKPPVATSANPTAAPTKPPPGVTITPAPAAKPTAESGY